MVRLPAAWARKQAKKQKHITYPDALPGEVTLSGIALTKPAIIFSKHWVVMAKLIGSNFPSGHTFDKLTQA